MSKIKKVLKAIDNKLNEVKPSTMDDLIETVRNIPGVCDYGTSFSIVKYMGYLQGIRVYVTGDKLSHPLPSKYKVYSTFKGIEKYENAGFMVEHC
jgi:hypothetical protein